MSPEQPSKRCAIYTRKSAEEARSKDFSTLENQRDYCAAYVRSQAGGGWCELPARYDDGGFSGGNLNRPGLRQLRSDIVSGLIDIVVVYKIDRLSRSLRDFGNLVSEFEATGTTFVSVTQAFDTGTSMGRLTLNMLLSFAQFERELTAERLTDWFAGARAKGLWVPCRPYGYIKINGNALVPCPVEAPIVRSIFERYCKLSSCRRVADELFANGILNKAGRPWSATMVKHTIRHRVYLGEIVHRREGLPGHHEPIVSARLWQRTQAAFAASRSVKRATNASPVRPMLKGLVFDRVGMRMHHTFLHARGHLYRYYVAAAERRRYGHGSDAYMRFRAADLEASVSAIVDRMAGITQVDRHQQQTIELVRRYVERVDIDLDGMRVRFRTGAVVEAEAGGRLGSRQFRPGARRAPKLAIAPNG